RFDMDDRVREGLGEHLQLLHELPDAHELVVLLGPEDQPTEGAAFGKPAIGDRFDAAIVRDEDPPILRRTFEMHFVRRSFWIDVDRPHDVPAPRPKGLDQRTVDVRICVKGKAASHYWPRDSAQA